MMIMGMPAYAAEYDFIVARFCDGEAWFWGAYSDWARASQAAEEADGFVVVRAQHV